jgi:SAM-dependent MidA family methyltransferase
MPHSEPTSPLEVLLRETIARQGPMRFDAFMEAALYHPAHGYYSSGRAKIGRDGDFFTSVSIAPLFGRLLARQIAGLWAVFGSPNPFRILEQGAHQGALMRDLLDALERDHPDCAHAAEPVIVEPFDQLRSEQQRTLGTRVRLVRHLAELDPSTGVHISNELLDAFPVRLIEKQPDGSWRDVVVAFRDDRLLLDPAGPEAAPPAPLMHALDAMPPGTRTEFREGIAPWFDAVARAIPRGAVLALDYGYPRDILYLPRRAQGTLSAYRDHRRVTDPTEAPGITDLTAHVDFTGLAEAATDAGFALAGFADQQHFLLGLALADFDRWEADPANREGVAERRALQTLTHPGTMGADFHAVLFVRGIDGRQPITGFELENRLSSLVPAPIPHHP